MTRVSQPSEVVDVTETQPADVDLSVDLGPATLANPVLAASGCFASGREIDRFFDVGRLGAVIVKSLTLEPRGGLPTPRMAETPSGMLNAIGLQNPGIDRWLADDLPWLLDTGVPTVVSIAGNTVDEFGALARKLRRVRGLVAVEANISCPNVEDRDRVFACREETTGEAVRAVTDVLHLPVFAKLSPDVTDIVAIAEAARGAGATGVSLVNTLLGMAIDVERRRPRLAAVTGGLSGPAIKPVAVRAVYQVHRAMPSLPIIGTGGVRTVADVVELVLAGASAVAVGTATFANPMATVDLVEGLPGWLAARGHTRLADLRGAVAS
ncbi:dihydroorotate dehydrogenase [soil metagenome]